MPETLLREYREAMAVLPAAMGAGFSLLLTEQASPSVEFSGKVAVVPIRGVLEHHASPWCDSYDSIKSRVSEALASQAEVVLLSIDSPGGMVSGAFDCSDELRAMAAASGKRLISYVDGTTASAGYALACAADQIVIPPAGVAGSVGTICAIATHERAADAAGVSLHVIKSGARKADGNPDEALTEAGAVELQAHIDAQAAVFFELVSRARGISVETIAGWEGRVFIGADAVSVGLADSVASEDQLVALLNAEQPAAVAPQGQEKTSMDLDEMKKALAARAEDQELDENERSKAKAALAALDGEEEKKDEPEEEKKDEPEEEKPSDDEAKAASAVAAKALALAESTARAQIMATRPDLSEQSAAYLQTVALTDLPRALAAIPRIPSPAASEVAASVAVGVTGGGADDSLSEGAQAILSAYRGETTGARVEHTETHSVFRPMTPAQAAAFLASRGGDK